MLMAEPITWETIEAKSEELGYRHGWTLMATPEATLREAKVAFVGLNPGGGGEGDTYPYGGLWDVPGGNAYFTERWGPNGTETPIQAQIHAWHRLLELEHSDSLCMQFVPFRSPSWHALDRKDEALAFSRELWRWVLTVSPATLFVTMGKLPARYLAELLNAKHFAQLPTGWGANMIDVRDSPSGRRIVGMPHPSRYRLFGRVNGASLTAEASFRSAAGLDPLPRDQVST